METEVKISENNSHKSILILGNGFDIRHGLPTRYTDFMTFVNYWDVFYNTYCFNKPEENENEQYEIDVNLTYNNELRENSLKEFGRFPFHYNHDDIEFLNKNLLNNIWITYFRKVQADSSYNWIDFENEIQNVIEIVDRYFDLLLSGKIQTPCQDIEDSICNVILNFEQKINNTKYISYLNEIRLSASETSILNSKSILNDFMADSLEEMTECFRLYLKDFISRIRVTGNKSLEKDINPDYVITFNYTETIYKLWDDELILKQSVHGRCATDYDMLGGNIVLGIEDNKFGDRLEHTRFQKYYQRIIKKTGGDYRAWVQEGKSKVSFIGFSFSKMDEGIIKTFFENDNVEKITVYYLRQCDFESYTQKLIEIFDKENIIKWVGDRRLVFEKIEED